MLNCIASLSNNYLANGSRDHNIIIWDTNSGNKIRTIKGTSKVYSLEVLSNDRIVGGYGNIESGKIEIFNVSNGDRIHEIEKIGIVYSMCVLPNGNLVSSNHVYSYLSNITVWKT